MVYFDNAATSFPKPPAVQTAVLTALTRYGANPGRSGHDLSVQTARQVFEVREKAASFFGAENPEHVVFTQNCTYALNTVIQGLFQSGDHVVISDLEHNSVLRPIWALAQQRKISYTVAKVDLDEERTVASFQSAIQPNTKAILCTHGSNVFGIRLPAAKLAKLAKSYGLYFILDAAQTAGTEPIHMREMGIDFLCAPGHKGLYGPSGTGLLITACGQKLRPLVKGGTGSVSSELAQPEFLPDRLESGTLNTMGILGLGAGIDFVQRHGRETLARYEMSICRSLYQQLHSIEGVILYTPEPIYQKSLPLFSFNIEGLTSEETTQLLNQEGLAVRGGLHCAPDAHQKFHTFPNGAVRVSIGAFNTMEQAREFAYVVRKIAKVRQHVAKKD